MKLNKRPCTHCEATGGLFHIDDESFCRYCGKTQRRTTLPPPKPRYRPIFVREAKRLRAKRFKRACPPMLQKEHNVTVRGSLATTTAG